jgi:hypothetical protein
MRESNNRRGFAGFIVVLLCGFLMLDAGLSAKAGAATEVKITSPHSDSVVKGTVPISLTMGSETSWVDVYIDGVYLASTPGSISWSSATSVNGKHVISAEAYDSSGQLVGTADRSVHLRNKGTPTPTATPTPTGQATITSPASGATVSGTVSIAVSNVEPVSWVNFYVDGTWVASSPPFTYAWNSKSVANGQHAISVNGYNDSNAPVATSAINLNVENGSATPTPAPSATPTARPTSSSTVKPTATPSSTATSYYSLLPAGSALPSDSTCATGAAGDTFEPVPANAVPNNFMPTSSDLSTYKSKASGGEGGAPGSYLTRADGQFTGTTDGILKWASCKWGFDENVTRATAVNETHWLQLHVGDIGNGTSLGILQIKSSDYPSTCESVASSQNTGDVTNSDCYSYLSTAFAADYKLAQQRACFEGQVSYLTSETPTAGYPTYPNGTADQMMWGCVGWWYSGSWYDSGALNYISQVQGYLADQTWLQSGGVGN